MHDADLPFVHEIDDGLYFPSAEVLEDDDGMFAGVLGEDPLEERGAGAQDDLVCSDGGFGAHQGHVDERLRLKECVERRQDVTLVVVPT